MTVVDMSGTEARRYLRHLLANDVARLKEPGQALYSAMLRTDGGIIDDLIVYRMSFGYRIVVNCATRDKDLAWMNSQTDGFEVAVTNGRIWPFLPSMDLPQLRRPPPCWIRQKARPSLD